MTPEPKQPGITLEDLLKLKRAERPPVEFWDRFDRDMRVKQLAAMVEPKPWWLGLSLAWSRFAPYALPTSGAAAVLVAVLALQTGNVDGEPGVQVASDGSSVSVSAVQDELRGERVASVTAEDSAVNERSAAVESVPAAPVQVAAVEEAPRQDLQVASASLGGLVETVMPGGLVAMLPGAGLHLVTTLPETAVRPSDEAIAGNLAALSAEDPALSARLGLVRAALGEPVEGFASRAASANTTGTTTDRLLALASFSGDSVADSRGATSPVGERLAHRLDDDLNPVAARRLGVGGNRVSLRF